MKFEFDKTAWTTLTDGEKNCYLMTNGLGGYNSMNLVGGVTRGDQAFFMAAKKAPNVRFHMITGLLETLKVDGKEYVLTSQRMKSQPDLKGFQYLESFVFDNYPQWVYRVEAVTVTKTMVMVQEENTVAVRYEIHGTDRQKAELCVKPMLRMTAKNTAFEEADAEAIALEDAKVIKNSDTVFIAANGCVTRFEPQVFGPLYFSQDERDGRNETGSVLFTHSITFAAENGHNRLDCVFSTDFVKLTDDYFNEILKNHKEHVRALMDASMATSELGRQLSVSADAYLSRRDSTNGKTILAGFPFFEDWGRDTMISLPGITMITGRFKECKSILRTFAKYVKNGLLPNLFPEGDCNPMYNSADAPLLFINAAYEYVRFSGDEEFIKEIFPVLESIIEAYKMGTDFHIKMEDDGLISAGAGLEQLTWMDVRIGDYLPTPRHGKPVEINAYWYSALCTMAEFAKKLLKLPQAKEYEELAGKVKDSFLEKFWNEKEHCLKDVLSGTEEENQVRCNQIWALTQPFTMLSEEQEKLVIEKVRDELYTTAGLRTLSPKDPAFREFYIGPMQQRDRAYHQGTVWAFPLGAYYRACIKFIKKAEFAERIEWKQHVSDGRKALIKWLFEGCVGQIAEIYDGGTPTVSRGCYAQAWSVGELLRAVYEFEDLKDSES